MEFIESIRNIDAYAKTSKKVKLKTVTGALVLLCLSTFIYSYHLQCFPIGVLFLLEVRGYFSSKEHHTVSVDTSNAGELMITFDITFPNAPCPHFIQISWTFLALETKCQSLL